MRTMIIGSTLVFILMTPFGMQAQSAPNPQGSSPADSAQTPPVIYEAPARPTEDWNRVLNLVHDEEINVWASRNRHVRCLFTGATNEYLFCEPAYSRWHSTGSGEYRFNRADVDKIRLEQGERNFKAAIATTTVAGAITGAAVTSTNYAGERVLGALAGGLAGVMAGAIVAVPVAILVPGHLVYQRPHPRPSVRPHSPNLNSSEPTPQTN
jgi:hypothetical protein